MIYIVLAIAGAILVVALIRWLDRTAVHRRKQFVHVKSALWGLINEYVAPVSLFVEHEAEDVCILFVYVNDGSDDSPRVDFLFRDSTANPESAARAAGLLLPQGASWHVNDQVPPQRSLRMQLPADHFTLCVFAKRLLMVLGFGPATVLTFRFLHANMRSGYRLDHKRYRADMVAVQDIELV